MQRKAITEILQGCLLALAFTDNDYTNIRQVAYMAECVATYNPKLEGLNHYDVVFCPAVHMITDLKKGV